MVTVYYDADADLADIQNETIALIGYGIQGRAQGHNLRDSGLNVIIGNRDDQFRQKAVEDGFEVYDVAEAARRADIIVMLIPDEVQAEVYQKDIEPNLAPNKALVFAHGFAIRYNLIDPPKTIDTVLVSPRMPGRYVRDFFLRGDGVPVFVDVHHDASGRAWQRTRALAKAIGATRPGAMAISFAEETELDHFAEHYLYPLVIGALQQSYEVLVENGYTPEAAVMELYGSRELGEVFVTAAQIGLYNMVDTNASPACQYGIHSYQRKLYNDSTRQQIQTIIDDIKNGSFARELLDDQKQGSPRLKAMAREAHATELEQTETRLREIMKFKTW
jgi:ketol-acid reductoisomerase